MHQTLIRNGKERAQTSLILNNSGQNILVFMPGLWFTKKFRESAEWCKKLWEVNWHVRGTKKNLSSSQESNPWPPRHRAGVRDPTPGMGRVMGSIPVGDSDFFFVPRSCHVDGFAIYETRIVYDASHTSVIATCTHSPHPGKSGVVSYTVHPGRRALALACIPRALWPTRLLNSLPGKYGKCLLRHLPYLPGNLI